MMRPSSTGAPDHIWLEGLEAAKANDNDVTQVTLGMTLGRGLRGVKLAPVEEEGTMVISSITKARETKALYNWKV
jgi:hypothetical protein